MFDANRYQPLSADISCSKSGHVGKVCGCILWLTLLCTVCWLTSYVAPEQQPQTGAGTVAVSVQVADAEAATAILVAQMTESSPNQDAPKSWPLQLVTGQKAGDGRSAHEAVAAHQQHSSDRENVPQPQQRAGKRGSKAGSEHALPAADLVAEGAKKPAKRRKVSSATDDTTAAQAAATATSTGLPSDVQDIVGRTVQQQFQEGLFKVGTLIGFPDSMAC